MPAEPMSYKKLRRHLDELGYYQPLVPEALPLVEALLNDLLATTHNLKLCKEQKRSKCDCQTSLKNRKSSNETKEEREAENLQIIALKRKVGDLQLLQHESLEVIKSLQCEIEERNKKLLKLELLQKAQVVTQNDKLFKPRIELTSLVEDNSSSSGPTYDNVAASRQSDKVDVIRIYSEKNKSLEKENQALKDDLKAAKQMQSTIEKYWSQQSILENPGDKRSDIIEEDPEKSAYALKLLKENRSLKEKLAKLESDAPVCFHGQCLPPKNASTNPGKLCDEHIRSSVEESHVDFQNRQTTHLKSQISSSRLKRHPVTSVHGPSYSDKIAQKNHHHLNHQHTQIHELQEELRKSLQTNQELNRRVAELSKIKDNLKSKMATMEKQQAILLKNTNGAKVTEILDYVEKQRNIYRNNIQQLLSKLDPDGRALEELEKCEEQKIPPRKGPSSRENLELGEASPLPEVTIVSHRKPKKEYSPAAYKSSSSIEPEEPNLRIDSFKSENARLLLKIRALEEKVALLEHQAAEARKQLNQKVGNIREETSWNQGKYQEDILAFQREVKDLNLMLSQKEADIRELMADKDSLHQQLDEKAIRMESLQQRLIEAESQKVNAENAKRGQFRKIEDCMGEIENLRRRSTSYEGKIERLQSRLEAEQELSREVRSENAKLKEDLDQLQSDSDSKSARIEDLRSHIQRYVTEVKRIEELLAIRERERSEVLNQYKMLNDEAEHSFLNGRKLESKVEELQMEIQTKNQELKASEMRLTNMEQDLVEMSLANDNYRSQVINLSTRVDIAETEMRAMRTQESWLGSDTLEIQKLNDELVEQKAQLLEQIAKQAEEIEELTVQIRELRSELDRLHQKQDIDNARQFSRDAEKRH